MPGTLRVTSAGFFALLLTVLSVAHAKPDGSDSIKNVLASHHFRRVALERSGPNLFVRANINGKPAALVIDTAAPFTTLDRNSMAAYRVDERRTSMSLSSPMGKTNDYVGLSKLRSIELANIVLSNDSVTVVDLSAMNRGKPVRAAGVFGFSHMRKLDAIIDCGQRAIYLSPLTGIPESESNLERFLTSRGFVRVPMRVNSAGNPEVDCRINGVASRLTVETAAFTTILEKRVALRAGMRLARTGFSGEGVGRRTTPISEGVAKQFWVGAFKTENQKLSAGEATFGVLGIDYLLGHDAIIDCGDMNLFLRHHR